MNIPARHPAALTLLTLASLFFAGCTTNRGATYEIEPPLVDSGLAAPAAAAAPTEETATGKASKQEEGEVPLAVAESEHADQAPREESSRAAVTVMRRSTILSPKRRHVCVTSSSNTSSLEKGRIRYSVDARSPLRCGAKRSRSGPSPTSSFRVRRSSGNPVESLYLFAPLRRVSRHTM